MPSSPASGPRPARATRPSSERAVGILRRRGAPGNRWRSASTSSGGQWVAASWAPWSARWSSSPWSRVVVTLPKVGGLARIADDLSGWAETHRGRVRASVDGLWRRAPPTRRGAETGEERTRAVERATSVAAVDHVRRRRSPSARRRPFASPAASGPRAGRSRPALERPVRSSLSRLPGLRPPERAPPARPRSRPGSRRASLPPAKRRPAGDVAQGPDPRGAAVREPAAARDAGGRGTPAPRPPPEGLPRVELSRQPAGIPAASSSHTVRLVDPGGWRCPAPRSGCAARCGTGRAARDAPRRGGSTRNVSERPAVAGHSPAPAQHSGVLQHICASRRRSSLEERGAATAYRATWSRARGGRTLVPRKSTVAMTSTLAPPPSP